MSDAVALYDEADQLKNEGKLEEAALKFKESIEVDPEYALSYSALAVVLQKLGQHDQAITHAQRVCELQPDDPFSYTAMSVTYQRAYAGTNNMEYIRLAEEAMEKSRVLQMGG
jgi:tetratricopeptide (TPR) repeat protein